MSHYHAVVWLDHAEAHIFSFNLEEVEEKHLLSHPYHRQTHHRAGVIGSGKSDEDLGFFRSIVAGVEQAREILIVGPGAAKLAFIRYLHGHDPAFEARIVGVETMDHPSSAQIVAYARKYFHAADRMRPQRA